ncbi:hypothetical protein Q5P01_006885 [Channa striata]|uniref:Uncharacterized protein n=1 Tax=Channa striata TaxID=64152 RepID=A0AA88T160_CHASR|nr:hypothetical protein Q5P01_006885 [Channa striata]
MSFLYISPYDAPGRLQGSVGLCVFFKGKAGENFRSDATILQLPARSRKTPLSAAGINPTTFRLLVSLHIQASPGRGGTLPWAGQINTLAGETGTEAAERPCGNDGREREDENDADEDLGSIAVATETGADVTLVAGRLAGALIVTVTEMQLDGTSSVAPR